jgi:hypothetical protein
VRSSSAGTAIAAACSRVTILQIGVAGARQTVVTADPAFEAFGVALLRP